MGLRAGTAIVFFRDQVFKHTPNFFYARGIYKSSKRQTAGCIRYVLARAWNLCRSEVRHSPKAAGMTSFLLRKRQLRNNKNYTISFRFGPRGYRSVAYSYVLLLSGTCDSCYTSHRYHHRTPCPGFSCVGLAKCSCQRTAASICFLRPSRMINFNLLEVGLSGRFQQNRTSDLHNSKLLRIHICSEIRMRRQGLYWRLLPFFRYPVRRMAYTPMFNTSDLKK